MEKTNNVSSTATATMHTVVKLFVSMDKAELNKSQLRIKIGDLFPKLRAEYGKNVLSSLKAELTRAGVRESITISTLNVWACIYAFYCVNPAIEKLSEKFQRRFATLFDASVTKLGEHPKLSPKVDIPAKVKKMEFHQLRELANDTDTFNSTFGVKLSNTVTKVTDKQVADIFNRLRKMKDDERAAIIALIKKELATPIKVKAKKGTKKTVVQSTPIPPEIVAPEDKANTTSELVA